MKYKLLKDEGNNSNITIENSETKASIMIGKITYDLLAKLTKAGIISDTDGLPLKNKWEYEISDETAKELSKIALQITKPKRDQSKKQSEQPSSPTPKEDRPVIDAMDVLLGLAKY